MNFGEVALAQAKGAVLAHSLHGLRKGRVLGAADIARLAAAGVTSVTVARLAPGELGEDDAAAQIGAASGLPCSAPHAGRVNLVAPHAGVLALDEGAINGVNAIDPAITLATLPPFARVTRGQLLATIKIIPYGVEAQAVARAAAAISGAFVLHGVVKRAVALVLSEVAGMKPSLLDKGRRAVEARLARFGLELTACTVVPHRADALALAINDSPGDLLLLLGASATSDIRDTAPEALRRAGGAVQRFGIPVDPGNLLFIGSHKGRDVLGLPGCARALALNGADWVLERLLCGIRPDNAMLAGMGVGGLLKEIPSRPQPRRGGGAQEKPGEVAVILLAAGQSRRMGGVDKLLEPVGAGEQGSLLAHCTKAALASRADRVLVALPPGALARRSALAGLAATPVAAPDHGEGMGATLRNAMAHIGPDVAAVIVALADMPGVTPAHYNALIKAHNPSQNAEICRAMAEDGTPGHPVLFGRRFFEALAESSGDQGPKTLLRDHGEYVVNVPTKGQGATLDLDTPAAWKAWRGQ